MTKEAGRVDPGAAVTTSGPQGRIGITPSVEDRLSQGKKLHQQRDEKPVWPIFDDYLILYDIENNSGLLLKIILFKKKKRPKSLKRRDFPKS